MALCPALAVTTSLMKGFSLGVVTLGVLLLTSIVVSLLKNKLVINRWTVMILTGFFVTIADLLMQKFFINMHVALGIYLPLTVVNCMLFSRLEIYSAKENFGRTLLDSLGYGFGFILSLCLLGGFREVLGTGQLLVKGIVVFSWPLLPQSFFLLAPGAFMSVALLLISGRLMVIAKKALKQKLSRKHD